MTENSAHLLQWIPLAAAFAFIIGEAYSDLRHHRKCFQEATQELRERLEQAMPSTDSIHRELKQQRGVINDIHRRLLAVSKGLEKRKSMAGSSRSGRSIRYSFGNNPLSL